MAASLRASRPGSSAVPTFCDEIPHKFFSELTDITVSEVCFL
jgi:hypothetical protein